MKQTTHDVVPESDWAAARDVVKAELQPDDLVVFAPFWADPLGRRSFGDDDRDDEARGPLGRAPLRARVRGVDSRRARRRARGLEEDRRAEDRRDHGHALREPGAHEGRRRPHRPRRPRPAQPSRASTATRESPARSSAALRPAAAPSSPRASSRPATSSSCSRRSRRRRRAPRARPPPAALHLRDAARGRDAAPDASPSVTFGRVAPRSRRRPVARRAHAVGRARRALVLHRVRSPDRHAPAQRSAPAGPGSSFPRPISPARRGTSSSRSRLRRSAQFCFEATTRRAPGGSP